MASITFYSDTSLKPWPGMWHQSVTVMSDIPTNRQAKSCWLSENEMNRCRIWQLSGPVGKFVQIVVESILLWAHKVICLLQSSLSNVGVISVEFSVDWGTWTGAPQRKNEFLSTVLKLKSTIFWYQLHTVQQEKTKGVQSLSFFPLESSHSPSLVPCCWRKRWFALYEEAVVSLQWSDNPTPPPSDYQF